MRKIQRGGWCSCVENIKTKEELIKYLYNDNQLGSQPNKYLHIKQKIMKKKSLIILAATPLYVIMQKINLEENTFADDQDELVKSISRFYNIKLNDKPYQTCSDDNSDFYEYDWIFSKEKKNGNWDDDPELFNAEIERYKIWKKEKEGSNGGKKRRTRKKYKKRQTRKKTRRHHSRRL